MQIEIQHNLFSQQIEWCLVAPLIVSMEDRIVVRKHIKLTASSVLYVCIHGGQDCCQEAYKANSIFCVICMHSWRTGLLSGSI